MSSASTMVTNSPRRQLKRVEIGAELPKILVEMDDAEARIVAGMLGDDVPAVVS